MDGLFWERGLSSAGAQARNLAAALIEGADEIDRWVVAACGLCDEDGLIYETDNTVRYYHEREV